jgi:hypothetical protein
MGRAKLGSVHDVLAHRSAMSAPRAYVRAVKELCISALDR